MAAPVGVMKRMVLLQGHLEQVASVLAPLRAIDPTLHDLLQPLLALEVAKLSDRVKRVADAEDPWAELREMREDAAGLFTECLGFLGGAVALDARLDQGRCRIANHLVATLRNQALLYGPAVSVPAQREYVNVLSGLIRLRFPGEGLWDLPVVVHELGHAVSDDVGKGAARDAIAVAATRERARPGRRLLERYDELWADVFGTYVAGPAYAATCLRIRFDPSRAGDTDLTDTHPSMDKRAEAILATLEHVEQRRADTGAISGSLASVRSELEEDWLAELTDAGRSRPPPPVWELVNAATADYCRVLDDHLPSLRCGGLGGAQGAAHRLRTSGDRPPAAGVLDTLNAAWLVRMDAERNGGPFDADAVAARALAWCTEVVGG